MKSVFIIFITALTLCSLQAQVYTPPPAQPAAKPASKPSSPPPAQKSNQPSPFGSELPFLDPTTETITWNGKTWAASDNRLFAARFEKFLAEPPDSSEAAIEYRKNIDAILHAVSPHNPKGLQLKEGFILLPRASAYPGDAKLCDSLAQVIYTALLAKNDIQGIKQLSKAMDQERKRLIRNADITASKLGIQENKNAKNDPSKQKAGKGITSLYYVDNTRRIAEINALQKAQRAKTELRVIQAKIEYQAFIVQLFVQRRFEHVIMASRFYTAIWRDGDNAIKFERDSDIGKLFSEGFGMNPTVGTLDSLANEAIRDINKGVEAFLYLVERNELHSAAKRLTETYVTGEFLPAITTLRYESKRKVQLYVRESYKLIAALDSRDYASAQAIVEELTETVPDFDGTKARAAIAAYTRASDMSIMMAKNHLAKGDTEAAQAAIQKAVEAWPQNPKLNEFDRLVERGGSLYQARNDFDRLLSEKNYREIQKRQYEFAPAINDDPTRLDAFTQIMGNIKKIEGGLFAATQLSDAGQSYAAYERLRLLRDDYPNDPVLGRRIEELSSKVSEFTSALEKAKTLEKRTPSQRGSALSWYLKAKRLHPSSEIAEKGIKRLLDHILPE